VNPNPEPLKDLLGLRAPRAMKPWQRPSDHTPRRRPIAGWMKEPGQTNKAACKVHRTGAKRLRRKADGRNYKVTVCPRCERAA
jgi:hypothetical protein